MSAPRAISGAFVKLMTMADGTPRITIDLDCSLADASELMLSPGVPLAVARLTEEAAKQANQQKTISAAPEPDPGRHGHHYTALYRAGWFYNRKVWPAMGTDDEFRAWVQRQPSCISGQFSEFLNGEGRSIAAHVRRVRDGAGMAEKPPYACIPLTDAEHQLQHQHGESYFGGPEFFDKKRAAVLVEWIKSRLYAMFNVSTMAGVSPAEFRQKMREAGIEETLPQSFGEQK